MRTSIRFCKPDHVMPKQVLILVINAMPTELRALALMTNSVYRRISFDLLLSSLVFVMKYGAEHRTKAPDLVLAVVVVDGGAHHALNLSRLHIEQRVPENGN